MDEPTSSLSRRETEQLFRVIRDLRVHGVGVLYISHRLQEVQEVADRVVVLRDGRNAGELAGDSIRHDAMVRMMVGRDLSQFFPRTHRPSVDSRVVFRVRDCRLERHARKPIAFQLRAGEIVGLAGLVGAGRTELAEALFGLRPMKTGVIELDGRAFSCRRPQDAIRAGIFLVPEDRRAHGLVLGESVARNISIASLDRLTRLRMVCPGRERRLVAAMCRQLAIRSAGPRQSAGLLSGGNQQKVVLAKWLALTPRVLILDEPTRGVDVGAKAEIYRLMDNLTQQGVAILMISSDLEEILGMSDRVLVMHDGTIAGELRREALSEAAIMHLATGGGRRA